MLGRSFFPATALLVVMLGGVGCKRHAPPEAEASSTAAGDGGVESANDLDGAVGTTDTTAFQTGTGSGAVDAATLPHLLATASPTPIFSAPEWPATDPTKTSEARRGVSRLGYLRKGQPVAYKAEAQKKPNCTEGWYELAAGGFVCGKFVTLDPADKALKNAPHAPLTDGPLPYAYGLNITNGTPLYRRPPLRKERAEFEHALAIGKTPKAKGAASGSAPSAASAPDDDPTPAAGGGAAAGGGGGGDEKPWYLRDHHGARPQVKLDELRGESTLIEERMVRGFYLALDKEIGAFSGKFWLTTNGLFAPADHVLVHKATTEFEGVWVGNADEKRKLPLAFILSVRARKFTIDDADKRARRGDTLVPRFTIAQLTGKTQILDGRSYFETDEGWWMRDYDGTVVRPTTPPAGLGPNEKWIDVNIRAQTLVAYEGDRPVYATIISSGRHDDNDKSKDHRTVTGTFRIREKHIAATMEDDGASDGPYSIQDVPWIMYFEGSYALHGAFWHSSFGHERSHGCVNMTPHDAKAIFGWAGPNLPEGWHGVFATPENQGTRVVVHE